MSNEDDGNDAAYVFIKVGMGKAKTVVEALRQISEIKTAHICWGIPDIVAFAEVPELQSLTNLVLQRVQGIEGVPETDTRVVAKE